MNKKGPEIIFDESLLNPAFRPFFYCWNRIVVLWGGGGSGKSVAAVQTCIIRMMQYEAYNGLVCKQVDNSIKYTIFSEFKRWIIEWNLSKFFKMTDAPMRIICKRTGSEFRFKGMGDVMNIKSLIFSTGPIVCLLLDEASQMYLRDFLQLNMVRMRGETKIPKQTIIIFNPEHDELWQKKLFFDMPIGLVYHCQHNSTNIKRLDIRENQTDGPVERRGFEIYTLYTNYVDNLHYGKEEKTSLLKLALIDETMADVYIGTDDPERRWGVIKSSRIFNNCAIYDFKDTPDEKSVYQGMDFGYNDQFYFERNFRKGEELFVFDSVSGTELDPIEKVGLVDWMGKYESFMENNPGYYMEIRKWYRKIKVKTPKYIPLANFREIVLAKEVTREKRAEGENKLKKNQKLNEIIKYSKDVRRCWITADNSDLSTIGIFLRHGYKIKAAKKGKGSVKNGITYLKQFQKIHIHSTNCPLAAREVKLYKWREDSKTGKIIDEPVDLNNHTWDARRYSHEDLIVKAFRKRKIEVL